MGKILSLILCISFCIPCLYSQGKKKSFSYGLTQRSYSLILPQQEQESYPLLLVLRGAKGIGKRMIKSTGLEDLAQKEGFILAFPEPLGGGWNDGRNLKKITSQKNNVDDTGFIAAFIEHLVRLHQANEKKVYVLGASDGGMMALRLGCELSHRIAAIVSVGGTLPTNLFGTRQPSRKVPVLLIHGTHDPLVPWDGGEVRFRGSRLGQVLSVAETVRFWASHNECSLSPEISWPLNIDPLDETMVRKEFYAGDSPVVLYAIQGGGHTWPQGHQYLPAHLIGKMCQDISASKTAWDFCKLYSLPE